MKAKKMFIVSVILALCGAIPVGIMVASDKDFDKELERQLRLKSLVGLKGVYILIVGLGPENEYFGLTEQQLQTDVELQLRRNGIKVLSRHEWTETPGLPYLYVNLNAVRHPATERWVSYNISVELQQAVSLVRDPSIKIFAAPTWSKGSIGIAYFDIFIETIRDYVRDYVNEFCNDYLVANPIESPKENSVTVPDPNS
jgi:hypothetical protein